MAVGHAGDLHMPDVVEVLPEFHREIAFDDLRVIEIHLHLEVGFIHFFDDRMRVGLRVQEVARKIARVDRLDQQRAAALGELACGESQVVDVHGAVRSAISARRNDPAHRVQSRSRGCFGILKRTRYRVAKFSLPAGQ